MTCQHDNLKHRGAHAVDQRAPTAFSGNIVVDGVAASVYNTALGGEAQMHAFMVLGRVLWRRAPWLLHAVHHARLAQPLSLAIGRLVAAVRPRCWSPCGFGAKQSPVQQVSREALKFIAWVITIVAAWCAGPVVGSDGPPRAAVGGGAAGPIHRLMLLCHQYMCVADAAARHIIYCDSQVAL